MKAINQDPGLDLEQGYVFMCHSVHENIKQNCFPHW